MKFRFVKKAEGRVKTYQGKTVATGEEIEFTGDFVQKAIANPDYEAVQSEPPKKKRAKKKVSRKKVTRRG